MARHLSGGTRQKVNLVMSGLGEPGVLLLDEPFMEPPGAASRMLPFWFSREIGTYAIDHTDDGYLTRGLVNAAVMLAVLVTGAAAASAVRLRRRPHLSFT